MWMRQATVWGVREYKASLNLFRTTSSMPWSSIISTGDTTPFVDVIIRIDRDFSSFSLPHSFSTSLPPSFLLSFPFLPYSPLTHPLPSPVFSTFHPLAFMLVKTLFRWIFGQPLFPVSQGTPSLLLTCTRGRERTDHLLSLLSHKEGTSCTCMKDKTPIFLTSFINLCKSSNDHYWYSAIHYSRVLSCI